MSAVGGGVDRASDETLMTRFRYTGEHDAVDVLVTRYAQPAFTIAFDYLHERPLAEDAVQESLLRLVRARHHYRPFAPFAQWYYAIVRNVCRDMIRRLRTHEAYRDRLEEPPVTETVSMRSEVWDAVRRLRPDERRVLVLSIAHGFTFAEIGAAVGCSAEAAKKRAQRALRAVRMNAGG